MGRAWREGGGGGRGNKNAFPFHFAEGIVRAGFYVLCRVFTRRSLSMMYFVIFDTQDVTRCDLLPRQPKDSDLDLPHHATPGAGSGPGIT